MKDNWKLMDYEELRAEVFNILNTPEKFNNLLVNESGDIASYTLSEEEYESFKKNGFAASCFDEEDTKEYARKILLDNIDKLTDSLLKNRAIIRFTSTFDAPVGKRFDVNNETELNMVRVTIRRSIHHERTEYGYYIASILPTTK